jgi:MoxR-like ATPase
MNDEFQQRMKQQAITNCQYLSQQLVGRETESRLILLTALAQQHSLLIGMPGTAKSLQATELCKLFRTSDHSSEGQTRIFQTLMMRFTKPDEIFGPLDIDALLESRQKRRTAGYLPESHIAFLDETFKANSAILNSLLTLMNERKYRNGDTIEDVPLISLIGASNELPRPTTADSASDALTALFDRFILRLWFDNLPDKDAPTLFQRYLRRAADPLVSDAFTPLPGHDVQPQPFTIADIKRAREEAAKVLVPLPLLKILLHLRTSFHEESKTVADKIAKGNTIRPPFYVSDRRWKNIIELMQTAAWYDGRWSVGVSELALLPALTACHKEDVDRIRQLCADFSSLQELVDEKLAVTPWCINQAKKTADNVNKTPIAQRKTKQQGREMSCLASLKALQQLADAQDRNFIDLESIWVNEALLRQVFAESTADQAKKAQPVVRTEIETQDFKKLVEQLESLQFDPPPPPPIVTELQPVEGCGLRFVHVATTETGMSSWSMTSVPAPFLLTTTLVSNRVWNRVLDLGNGDDKPKRGVTVAEINMFLKQLETKLRKELVPQMKRLLECRLPTVDEWRAAIRSIVPDASREGLEKKERLLINFSVNGKDPGLADVSSIKFKQGEEFYSLLGNCNQICDSGNEQFAVVGGYYLSSREECFNSIATPCSYDKLRTQAGFRIVLFFQ